MNSPMPMVTGLGQAGFRLAYPGAVIYIDPYLSDRVERLEGPQLKRLRPIPVAPDRVADANYVLVSHIHLDHCDIDTLKPIARASPQCRFIGPREVTRYLAQEQISQDRLIIADRHSLLLPEGIEIWPIPAAHRLMEKDFAGSWRYLGYVIGFGGGRILHTGDTCVSDYLIERIKAVGPIDLALLPVNECNFYRDRQGIVGNMSIRDAFMLAEEIGAKTVVPMHYDMFEPNQVYREEIAIVYEKMSPAFRLRFDPAEL